MDGFEEDDFLVLSVIFGPQEGHDVVGVGRLWDIGATDSFQGPGRRPFVVRHWGWWIVYCLYHITYFFKIWLLVGLPQNGTFTR